MFSFFSSDKKEIRYSQNEIIEILEANDSSLDESVINFHKNYNERHHDTNLLLAIAWNKKKAAVKLIDFDHDKTSINEKDDWPTCSNTPLILAAKTNAEDLVAKLISVGANVNAQDYRGFTALHYACLYRNELAIHALLNAKANLQLRNAFDYRPYDCYFLEIAEEDLHYRYGTKLGLLNPVPDINNHYFATHKKCLTAIRWYLPNLIVNKDLGKSELIEGVSLNTYAQYLLSIREPIYRADFYNAMVKCIVNNRSKMNFALQAQLYSNESIYKLYEADHYQLDPLDLAPRNTIHYDNHERWVELQEIKTPQYRL